MVLFYQVVQVLRGLQRSTPPASVLIRQLAHCSVRGSVPIERDALRGAALRMKCLAQEGFGCGYVAVRAQSEIYSVAVPVDCAIQVDPSSSNPHVRLIHPPGSARRTCEAVLALLKLRNIALHPTQNRGVRKMQTTFRHHFDQITQAQLVAQVPANAQSNDLPVEVPPCKELRHALQPAHLLSPRPYRTLADPICTRAETITTEFLQKPSPSEGCTWYAPAMQNVEPLAGAEDAVELFVVVFNHEEQYSIWPQKKRIPDGWYAAEMSGAKADCLEYIERVWTDMRPLSLRRAMDVSIAGDDPPSPNSRITSVACTS